MPDGVPPYVLVARIASIMGMSFSIAIGLLLLIGGLVLPSLVAFLFFIPSFGLMAIVERHASQPAGADRDEEAEHAEGRTSH